MAKGLTTIKSFTPIPWAGRQVHLFAEAAGQSVAPPCESASDNLI